MATMCRTSPWSCQNDRGLRLHTCVNCMSLQARDRVLYNNSHFSVTCRRYPKEGTFVRVVDVYARCLEWFSHSYEAE